MTRNYPSRKGRLTRQMAGLGLLWLVGSFSGCAVLSIPSYRAGHCGAPEWVEPMQADAASDSFALEEEFNDPSVETVQCDNASYVPVFPTIPTPKFYQRWKAKRDLPPGPDGLRFHPLPTRPMFQPRPTTDDPNSHAPPNISSSAYGQVPRGQQWSNMSSTPATGPTDVDQVAPDSMPTPTPSRERIPTPAPEELPSPSDED